MALVLGVLLLGACGSPDNADEPLLILSGLTVFDGRSDSLLTDATITIRGNRILSIEQGTAGTVPHGAEHLQMAGRFAMPGLWDMHVHLAFDQDLAPEMFSMLLRHGITSVRDTGGDLHDVLRWREESRRHPDRSPHVFVAGPLVDGHPTVYDGRSAHRPDISATVRTAEDARRIVDSLADAGVDYVKAYEMLTADAFHAVMNQARRRGLPVAGHVPFSVPAADASAAGLRSIEHFRNVEIACSRPADSLHHDRLRRLENPDQLNGGELRGSIHRAQRPVALRGQDEAACRELMHRFAEMGTAQIPTLGVMAGNRIRSDTTAGFRHALEAMPEPVRSNWREAADARSARDPEARDAYADWLIRWTAEAHRAGVPVLPGSDSPVPLAIPGYSLHEELRALVLAGLSPFEVLKAATFESARWFEADDSLGTIGPGFIADLVILDANPLEDIARTQRIVAVIRNGRLYLRE